MKQHRRLITLAALVASSVVFLPSGQASATTPTSLTDRVNRVREVLTHSLGNTTNSDENSQQLANNSSQSQSWKNASSSQHWNNWHNWNNWNNWGNWNNSNSWHNSWHNSWSNY